MLNEPNKNLVNNQEGRNKVYSLHAEALSRENQIQVGTLNARDKFEQLATMAESDACKEVIYIVGNNFAAFAQLENVFTISEVIAMSKNASNHPLREAICVIGQGVSEEEKQLLLKYSRKNKLGLIINAYQSAASHELTHKHKKENIMMTDPLVVIPSKYYRAYLITDDACAEMSDHQTGQHIQGMVLTEAARQMAIAVAEKYVLQPGEKNSSYCVLNSVNSSFSQFAFPVDIKIEHEILEFKRPKPGSYEVKTKTSFVQNDMIIASVDIAYSFHNKKLLAMLEKQLAEKTMRANAKRHLIDSYIDMAA